MGTPIETLVELFLNRIEKDRDFFQYFNLSESEAIMIARKRSDAYLNEALQRMITEGKPSVDFTSIEGDCCDDRYFTFDLTPSELYLIPSLMYESYLSRDVAYLKTLSVNYTATDLRVFDPSNARSTFMSMYQFVHDQNSALLDRYRNTDRNTNEYIGIDYAQYSAEEG